MNFRAFSWVPRLILYCWLIMSFFQDPQEIECPVCFTIMWRPMAWVSSPFLFQVWSNFIVSLVRIHSVRPVSRVILKKLRILSDAYTSVLFAKNILVCLMRIPISSVLLKRLPSYSIVRHLHSHPTIRPCFINFFLVICRPDNLSCFVLVPPPLMRRCLESRGPGSWLAVRNNRETLTTKFCCPHLEFV